MEQGSQARGPQDAFVRPEFETPDMEGKWELLVCGLNRVKLGYNEQLVTRHFCL